MWNVYYTHKKIRQQKKKQEIAKEQPHLTCQATTITITTVSPCTQTVFLVDSSLFQAVRSLMKLLYWIGNRTIIAQCHFMHKQWSTLPISIVKLTPKWEKWLCRTCTVPFLVGIISLHIVWVARHMTSIIPGTDVLQDCQWPTARWLVLVVVDVCAAMVVYGIKQLLIDGLLVHIVMDKELFIPTIMCGFCLIQWWTTQQILVRMRMVRMTTTS